VKKVDAPIYDAPVINLATDFH